MQRDHPCPGEECCVRIVGLIACFFFCAFTAMDPAGAAAPAAIPQAASLLVDEAGARTPVGRRSRFSLRKEPMASLAARYGLFAAVKIGLGGQFGGDGAGRSE